MPDRKDPVEDPGRPLEKEHVSPELGAMFNVLPP